MIKVSVIVPVYKVEQYLEECVASLTGQTLKDIEIILVDDGSPDGCPSLCDKLAKEDGRVKVIHKKNGGVSAARNDGLKIANGEYVIFCDSDDSMVKDGLNALYSQAIKSEAEVVIGDVNLIDEKGSHYVKFYKEEFTTQDAGEIAKLIQADIYRNYCPYPPEEGVAFGYGGPWNKLVKRDLLLNNDICFDLRVKGIFDDILYTAHILSKATRISYIHVPVYNYKVLGSSITHSFKPNVIEINDAIFNSWNEFFDKQHNNDIFQEPFYACVIRRLEESMKLYFLNDKNDKDIKLLKGELKSLIQREPYCSAIKKVIRSKLSKKQRLLVILGNLGLITLVFSPIRKRYM